MHARNRYRTKRPDFVALASRHPALRRCLFRLRGESTDGLKIDWANPEVSRALTQALLQEDFGLLWELPPNRSNLCPGLTRCLNYLHWIEDLLAIAGVDDPIRALDVGTGASCIFPLLGRALHPGWSFLATEVDAVSVAWAERNVQANGMQDHVTVLRVPCGSYIRHAVKHDPSPNGRFGFTMCNPPFFGSEAEADSSANPATAYGGTQSERVNEGGGEVDFVRAMVDDSCSEEMRGRAFVWYTSMLGRKSSLKPLIRYLNEQGVRTVRTTTLVQGETRRWAIAWSFVEQAEIGGGSKVFGARRERKRRRQQRWDIPLGVDANEAGRRLRCALEEHRSCTDGAQIFLMEGESLPADGSSILISMRGTLREAETELGFVFRVVQDREESEKLNLVAECSEVAMTRGKGRALFWRLSDKVASAVRLSSRKHRRRGERTKID